MALLLHLRNCHQQQCMWQTALDSKSLPGATAPDQQPQQSSVPSSLTATAAAAAPSRLQMHGGRGAAGGRHQALLLSHSQATGGDQSNALYLELERMGLKCWVETAAWCCIPCWTQP